MATKYLWLYWDHRSSILVMAKVVMAVLGSQVQHISYGQSGYGRTGGHRCSKLVMAKVVMAVLGSGPAY